MNVLIFGYGLKGGGYDNAVYYLKKGHEVRITDIRDEASLGESAAYLKSKGVQIIAGEHRVEDFKWADLVIKTPAVSPDNPFLDYCSNIKNDFACLFSDKHVSKVKIICITGTVGKTIAASAVCQALNKLGKKTRMCGNMGISPFTELEKWEKGNVPEYLVCELSSWQVRDTHSYLTTMPKMELAVITNTLIENEGEKSDIQQFYNNRMQMLGQDIRYLLCPAEDKGYVSKAAKIKSRSIGTIEYFGSGLSKELPSSMRSSFAILKRLGFSGAEINTALKSFKGVPHRNEIVKRYGSLLVINDSASTIPQAVSFTINNMKGLRINLICGGTGKNLNAQSLVEALEDIASVTLLDGSFTENKLIPALNNAKIKYNGPFKEMKDAVECAMQFTDRKNNGTEVLLLSPGASAFEYFANEYDRGDQFKALFK